MTPYALLCSLGGQTSFFPTHKGGKASLFDSWGHPLVLSVTLLVHLPLEIPTCGCTLFNHHRQFLLLRDISNVFSDLETSTILAHATSIPTINLRGLSFYLTSAYWPAYSPSIDSSVKPLLLILWIFTSSPKYSIFPLSPILWTMIYHPNL